LTKNAERREKFKKLGAAITALKKQGDPDAPDYFTGRESEFEHVIRAVADKNLNSRFPGAPQTRTWQLERTIPKD
jgi:hypothetical protein